MSALYIAKPFSVSPTIINENVQLKTAKADEGNLLDSPDRLQVVSPESFFSRPDRHFILTKTNWDLFDKTLLAVIYTVEE